MKTITFTFMKVGRALFVATAVIGVVCLLAGCGGIDKELVGDWVLEDGSPGMVLFGNGEGVFAGAPMKWGVLGNILMVSDPLRGEDISFEYKVSGYVVTLHSDGRSVKFVRRENLREYRKKKLEEPSKSSSQTSAPSSQQSGGGGGQGDAMAELEKEAARWIKGGGGMTFEKEGAFFKFNGYADEGMVSWTATGKKAIGDCPAGSEWALSIDPEDGTKSSNFPPKCNSITPKVIIDFNGGSGGGKSVAEYVKSGTEYLDKGDKNNNKADYDLAIAEFDRAIQLDPNNAAAYFGRGRGYLRKGDNSRAVVDYSQALRLNPNDAISYSNRGRAYARLGNYDNAIADFESAHRIDPNNAAIKQNLEKAKRREKGL